ncbi:hypothetical protein BLNAU_20213 [Blattamonas nauphoetae]|uniref:Uncharacterized protein n=1 Tax=Blattamonas nauphoetae TaxID=2049346 RepID=A0ABQ9WZD7_9EUKA|nr:hypothetical protein BLNAU_20213 [Blattamonas nauphoetae]
MFLPTISTKRAVASCPSVPSNLRLVREKGGNWEEGVGDDKFSRTAGDSDEQVSDDKSVDIIDPFPDKRSIELNSHDISESDPAT